MTQNENRAVNSVIIELVKEAKHKFIKLQEYESAAKMREIERYMTMEEGPKKDELAKRFLNYISI